MLLSSYATQLLADRISLCAYAKNRPPNYNISSPSLLSPFFPVSDGSILLLFHGPWLGRLVADGLGTQLLAIHQLTTSSPAEFDPVQVAPCLCGGRRTFCNKFAHFGGSKHLKHNTGVDTCLAGRGAENNMIYRPAFCKNNKAIKHGRWRKLHKELDIY